MTTQIDWFLSHASGRGSNEANLRKGVAVGPDLPILMEQSELQLS